MMRRDPDRFNVGDTVYHFDFRSNMSEVEVIKVGRLLVHVGPPGVTHLKDWRVQAFRIETGHLNERNFSSGTYIRTLAEHADDERRKVARKRLQGIGVRIEQYRGSGQVHLSPETIHAIANLIEADPEFTR